MKFLDTFDQTKIKVMSPKLFPRSFLLLLVVPILLFSSCASNYYSVTDHLSSSKYEKENDQLKYSYDSELLTTSGNEDYAKKADKKGASVLAVTITNKTDKKIKIYKDIAVFLNDEKLIPISPDETFRRTKQDEYFYFVGLLVGLIPGGAYAVYNYLIASKANKEYKKDILKYSLWTSSGTCKPGETVQGILGLNRRYVRDKIELKLKD